MSVTVNLVITELGVMAALLPAIDAGNSLRARMLTAEANLEQQGSPNIQMTISPLEQGLIMGALGMCTCQFSSGLRVRVQAAVQQKLAALGASLG